MISNAFKIVLLLVIVAGGVGTFVLMRLDNARLRNGIADARRKTDESSRLRAENERTQDLLTRATADQSDAARAIRAELERARDEVAELEKRAAGKHATDAASLAHNRDPEQGLVRLENFQNVGQATPAP